MSNLTSVGILILRLAFGLTFAAHGAQKLFGWFNGPGMKRRIAATRAMGLEPAEPLAWLNAFGEFLGGLGVAAGFITPVAALGCLASMTVAIAKVHGPKGFWNRAGGMEYPMILVAVAFVLMLIGPGRYSIDAALGIRWWEPWLAIIFLALSIAVALYAAAQRPPAKPGS